MPLYKPKGTHRTRLTSGTSSDLTREATPVFILAPPRRAFFRRAAEIIFDVQVREASSLAISTPDSEMSTPVTGHTCSNDWRYYHFRSPNRKCVQSVQPRRSGRSWPEKIIVPVQAMIRIIQVTPSCVLLGSIGRSEDGVLCERDYGQRISPIGFDNGQDQTIVPRIRTGCACDTRFATWSGSRKNSALAIGTSLAGTSRCANASYANSAMPTLFNISTTAGERFSVRTPLRPGAA